MKNIDQNIFPLGASLTLAMGEWGPLFRTMSLKKIRTFLRFFFVLIYSVKFIERKLVQVKAEHQTMSMLAQLPCSDAISVA